MATATRAPTSDEAASGTWSGSAGSRFGLVDDYPDTGGADILTGGTTAAVITFGFSAFAIPAGSSGISVQVQYHDGEAANGSNNCGGRIKVGGSYFNAATHNPSGTGYTSRSDNWATNPKTASAWTVDDVNGVGANALQAFGLNSTDSNPTWRFSGIRLQVTYTEPIAADVETTVSFSGSVEASVGIECAASAVVSFTGTSTGTVDVSCVAEAIIGFTGSAAATIEDAGEVVGEASAEVSFTGAATARIDVAGVAAATAAFSGSAEASLGITAQTGCLISFSGSAEAELNVPGTASANIDFAGSATAIMSIMAEAIGEWTVAGYAHIGEEASGHPVRRRGLRMGLR